MCMEGGGGNGRGGREEEWLLCGKIRVRESPRSACFCRTTSPTLRERDNRFPDIEKIELTGFEPATSSSRTKRATSLRYSSMHLSRAHYTRNDRFDKLKLQKTCENGENQYRRGRRGPSPVKISHTMVPASFATSVAGMCGPISSTSSPGATKGTSVTSAMIWSIVTRPSMGQ